MNKQCGGKQYSCTQARTCKLFIGPISLKQQDEPWSPWSDIKSLLDSVDTCKNGMFSQKTGENTSDFVRQVGFFILLCGGECWRS